MRSNTPHISFFFLQLVLVLHSQAQHLINLGDAVNSKYDEISPVISSDAKYLYFVRRNHPENTFGAEDSEDIWYSTALSPNEWSKAQRIPLLNIARYNSVVAISNDDQQLLINGVFSKDGREFLRRGLSVVTRNSDGTFGLPVALNIQGLANMSRGLNTTGTWDGSEKHIVLAFSEKYESDRYDLYITSQKQDGSWSRPVKMPTLCTSASEEAPCISNDDKIIYFSSDRAEAGKFEIYEAARLDSSWQNWSEPVVAKFPVNTVGYDSHLEFDKKDEYAYLSSNHNTMGGFDLFYVDLKGRPELITFKGKLIDEKTKKPYSGPFDVSINGKTCDSVNAVLDSGIFSVKLRTNRSYKIYAHVSGTLPVVHKIITSYSNTEQEFIIHFFTDDNDPSTTNDQLAGVVRDSTASAARGSAISAAGDSTVSAAGGSAISVSGDSTASAAGGSAISAVRDSTISTAGGSAISAAGASTANASRGSAISAAGDSTVSASRGSAISAAGDSTVNAARASTASAAGGSAISAAGDSTVSVARASTASAAGGSAISAAGGSTVSASRGSAASTAGGSTASVAGAAGDSTVSAARDSAISASGDSTVSTARDSAISASGDSTVSAAGGSAVSAAGGSAISAAGDTKVSAARDSAISATGASTASTAGGSAISSSRDSVVSAAGASAISAVGASKASAAGGSAISAARDSTVSASRGSAISTDHVAGNERKGDINGVRNIGKTITDIPVDVIVNKDNDGVLVKHDAKTGKTVGLIFHNIQFPFNKATFLPGSKDELGYLLKFMKDNPDAKVQIEGHTSSEGNRNYNNRLSLRRALSVQKYLVKNGVAKHRMKIRGFGPARPFSDNSTAEGRKENRRVEVNIM